MSDAKFDFDDTPEHEWDFSWPVEHHFPMLQMEESVALGRLFALAGYLPKEGKKQVADSVILCIKAHSEQKRASGLPYSVHPIEVAAILAEKRMDASTLSAALLHDVLEDSDAGEELVLRAAGEKALEMVFALSKIERLKTDAIGIEKNKLGQAQVMRKMLMAMGKDIRVIIVKLADRLHNMRTIEALRRDKAVRIARETREIYAPLASRLGLEGWRRELEDISFRIIYPWRSRIIENSLTDFGISCVNVTDGISEMMQETLNNNGIDCKVELRGKNSASVYYKMKNKHLSFKEIRDKLGMRIIVSDKTKCYMALGIVHEIFKPIPGCFKDYIAIPKANGYRAIHTSVLAGDGIQAEIQIRSDEMHLTAEEGICAHWAYKEGGDAVNHGTYAWLSSLMEINAAARLPEDFLDAFKGDLFSDEVYVFTPRGDCIALPRGASGIDFAYAIHSDIGDKMEAIVIDGRRAEPTEELASGMVVEIECSDRITARSGWLGRAVTGRARAHIRETLKRQSDETAEEIGRGALDWSLQWIGRNISVLKAGALESVAKKTGCESIKDLFIRISNGLLSARAVAAICAKEGFVGEAENRNFILKVRGDEGGWLRIAECCNPLPPAEIVGIIDPKIGLAIHRKGCRKLHRRSPQSLMPMEWTSDAFSKAEALIEVKAKNSRGVLAKMAGLLSENGVDISDVKVNGMGSEAHVVFTVRVGSENVLDSTVNVVNQKKWCVSAVWRRKKT